jgi:hypothetical protein
MYFLYRYEYGILKPAQAILTRGRGRGRIVEGMNQMGYNICIYVKVTKNPLYNYYILIKMLKNNNCYLKIKIPQSRFF